MVLNHEQIKAEKLISNDAESNYSNASYDLRIDKIITVNGEEKPSHEIESNSMVFVISKEKVNLPSDRIGYAFIKTRLSQRGIMANNIGIIDPQYQGYLSTVLTNFGKDKFLINEGEPFLRITISKFTKPKKNKDLGFKMLDNDSYVTMIKSKTMKYLDKNFINIDKRARKIEKSVNAMHDRTTRRRSKSIAGWIAALGLVLTGIGLILRTYIVGNHNDEIRELRKDVKQMQETYFLDHTNKARFSRTLDSLDEMDIYLYQKLEDMSTKLDSLVRKNK